MEYDKPVVLRRAHHSFAVLRHCRPGRVFAEDSCGRLVGQAFRAAHHPSKDAPLKITLGVAWLGRVGVRRCLSVQDEADDTIIFSVSQHQQRVSW